MVLATANGRNLWNTVVTAFTHRFSEFGGMTLFVVSSTHNPGGTSSHSLYQILLNQRCPWSKNVLNHESN